MKYGIYSREKHEYNTDPQRRCYYGAHYSSEWRWSEWNLLYHVPEDEVDQSLDSWKIVARKTCEFKAAPEGENPDAYEGRVVKGTQ